VRPLDPNLYYQIDDSRIGGTAVTIGAVPPLNDPFSYIVLVNNSRTGGVSVARAASSRLSRIDAGGSDNVNAGEHGVFRINPREPNVMRVASPADIAFPAADYRPGYRFVFTFDGARVTLVDTRPLHAIGLPLEASVVFDGTIPEGERPALAAALDGALATHNAPLRVSADGGFDGGARSVFSIGLTATGTGTQAGVTLYTADAALALSRNGETLAEYKGTVTEFDEVGRYRALRRFIINGTRWYQEIREAMDW
jgi:hypothetical protein